MSFVNTALCVLLPFFAAWIADPAVARAVRAELVVDALTQPVFVATPSGDARLFVVERAGRIRIVANGAIVEPPFLDIRDRVDTEREGGMTGLAFPDDYADTGRFYVYYTYGVPGVADRVMESRISAFQAIGPPASSSSADASQEQVIWSLPLPNTIHHGGTIAIREGGLFLALGDGGGATSEEGAFDPDDTAQNDLLPFGKLLRFDLSGIPPLTPQLLAKGFRNPYRFSFDSQTGDLYIGDVGQDTWEEIDVLPAGFEPATSCPALPNFGWDVLEGSSCLGPDPPGEPLCTDPCLISPIHEYPHEPVVSCRGAVTGGAVYRGAGLPAWQGQYLFGDFCAGRVFSLRWTQEGGAQDLVDRTSELLPEGGSFGLITGFGEDRNGEVYLTAWNNFSPTSTQGRLYRIPEPGSTDLAKLALGAIGSLAAATSRRG